ncbi:MAG: methyltransferase domain-containing protein [Candidatus Lokiarchaeota archaeon]|nr:methyltransferase domain-containing protein [Candidatus Lokiarchaeota archaeon]
MDKFVTINIIRNIILNVPKFDRLYLRLEGLILSHHRWKNYRNEAKKTINRTLTTFRNLENRIKDYDKNFSFKDKTILEIGPGSNKLLAISFILHGAKRVFLIDRYKLIYNNNFNETLNKQFIKFYSNINGIKNTESYYQIIQKIKYFGYSGIEKSEYLEKSSIDLIFSLSVLEHVKNLEITIGMMSYLIKNGGYIYSSVDLRDHFHIRDHCYLDFLKYPEYFWKLIGHTNRVRFNQYVNYIKKFNLKINSLKISGMGSIETISKIKTGFIEKYTHLSNRELSVFSFKILIQKE